jgi:hypothetical protein
MGILNQTIPYTKIRHCLKILAELAQFTCMYIFIDKVIIFGKKSYFLRVKIYQVAHTPRHKLGSFNYIHFYVNFITVQTY